MAFYVIEYRYAPDLKFLVEDMRPAHRTFLRELESKNLLVASGFFRDSFFDGAMLIVKADSSENALKLLEQDPFSVNGVITDVRARLWIPTMGTYAEEFDTKFPVS